MGSQTAPSHGDATVNSTSTAPMVVLAAALGLAAASWVMALREMRGMDMGVATTLGSLAFFAAAWMWMMAAMMLPGAVPAIMRRVHATGRSLVAPAFAMSYLAVWAVFGAAVYVLYRPHGTVAAGVITIAAGVYELTPLKRRFRRRCRDSQCSGFEFGFYCVGSSIGLMLAALGIMSVTWMAVIAVVVLAQKLLPARAAVDVPLAVAIVGLGILIVVGPAWVPGIMPAM